MLRPLCCALASLAFLAFDVAPLGARPSDLQAFLNDSHRFAGLHSFRLQLVSVSPKGSSARELIYVAPDKLRVEMNGTGLVVVVIGRNVWVRDPSSKWTKAKLANGDPFAPVNEVYRVVAQSKTGEVRFDGTHDLDGEPTHLYDIRLPPQHGAVAETTSIWIGVADGYPRRIVERNGPFTTTALYSDWNRPLSVSGP